MPQAPNMPSKLSKALAVLVVILVITSSFLAYYVIQQQKAIANQHAEIQEISARLSSAEAANAKLDLKTRELRSQLAVLRVALQQTTNIRLDASGAVISRKGSKSDGIVLR